MRRLLILLLGLVLIGILSYFCFLDKAAGIKNHLVAGADNAFNQKQMGWVDTSIKGDGLDTTRILTLNGVAPSLELKEEAGKIAFAQEGVAGVENLLVVKESVAKVDVPEVKVEEPKVVIPSPYELRVSKSEDAKIVLQGYVPNKEVHDSLVSKANTLFGSNLVTDELKESEGAPKQWADTAQLGLDKLADVNYGKYKIVDNDFTFKGYVDNADKKDSLTKELQANLYSGYKGDFIIDAPAVVVVTPEPEPVIEVTKPIFSCQEEFKKILTDEKIHFEYNKADVKSESYLLLDSLVEVASKCPEDAIAIEGHTDSDGRASYNQRLSQNRAEAVKSYLISKGIPSNRLKAVGYGEKRPIAGNRTAKGKAKNRRIEFTIIDIKDVPKKSTSRVILDNSPKLIEITSIDDMAEDSINLDKKGEE